ncbi:MAG: hypothetical protein JKY40_04105 [Gammaproteobacteria bacterium]|nr:hypothetical protein [Gammaproteobacteria bacterium]
MPRGSNCKELVLIDWEIGEVQGESTRNLGYAAIFGMIASFSATLNAIERSLRAKVSAKVSAKVRAKVSAKVGELNR